MAVATSDKTLSHGATSETLLGVRSQPNRNFTNGGGKSGSVRRKNALRGGSRSAV
jgi:hypothetical protein